MTFVRNFLIAFAIGLVVLIPVAYFGGKIVIEYVGSGFFSDDEDEIVDKDDTNTDDENVSGVLSLLMICTTEPDNHVFTGMGSSLQEENATKPDVKIDFMTLVSIDCNNNQSVVAALPGDMIVSVKGVDMSLTDAYYYMTTGMYGLTEDYLAQIATAYTGVKVDGYAYVDTDDFTSVAYDLGSVKIQLSEAIMITGTSTRFFPKGENVLTSSDLNTLINYKGYSSIGTRISLISDICKSVMFELTDSLKKDTFESLWNSLNNNINWHFYDFDSISEVKNQFFYYQKCNVNQVSVIGSYVTLHGETLFEVDVNATVRRFKQYS